MNHNKLLIATTNRAKLRELSGFFRPVTYELISLSDVSVAGRPEETGSTFKENAIIKARYYRDATGLPTLADDGGFEIDALNGEPGVKSHRWIHTDRDSSDEELIAEVFRRMSGIPESKRTARLSLVLAFVCCDTVETSAGVIEGIVPNKPADFLTPGFPYRSILFLPELGKYYNEDVLTPDENTAINHRKKAVAAIKPEIAAHFEI